MLFGENDVLARDAVVVNTIYTSPGNSTATGVVYSLPTHTGVAISQGIIVLDAAEAKGGFPESILVNRTSRFVATECQLVPYIKSFKASVVESKYVEEEITSKPLTPSTFPFAASPNAMVQLTRQTISLFVAALLSGNVRIASHSVAFNGPTSPYYATSDVLQTLFYGNFTGCPNPDGRLECIMGNIADALSKSIRDAPVLASGFDRAQEAGAVNGKTFVPVTFVHIQWAWISLPLCIWFMSTLVWLLSRMRRRSTNAPSWRSSMLPMAFLFTSEDDGEAGSSEDELGRRAGNTMVKIAVDRDRARFVHAETQIK